MITGIGTDVVDVDRVRAVYVRYGDHWLRRVLSESERMQCQQMSEARRIEFSAGRFAAKEAIAKAAGCGLARLRMSTVDVSVGPVGLTVRFQHGTEEPWHSGRWHVSISHTSSIALAVAVRDVD